MDFEQKDVVALIVMAVVTVAAPVLLLVGFYILFMPIRIIWNRKKLISDRLGPFSLLLSLMWTAALVPSPFLFLWGWLVRLGQALLIDAPQQAASALPTLPGACANTMPSCLNSVSAFAGLIWSTAISQPVKSMQVPPGTAVAFLVFAIAVTVLTVCRPAIRPNGLAFAFDGKFGAISMLSLSFLAALYLSITSILAIPVFSETVPDIAPIYTDMVKRFDDTTPKSVSFPNIVSAGAERDKVPDELAPAKNDNDAAGSGSSGFNSLWESQLNAWDRSSSNLRERATLFLNDTNDFKSTALSFFQVSDQGHVDEAATRRHATVLVNSYGLWMADYRSAIDRCAASLREGLAQMLILRNVISEYRASIGSPGFTHVAEQIDKSLQRSYGDVCANIKPIIREYLIPRSGPEQTLGLFGFASSWLLKTESPELALIVGLLGFGFFGALATSFIREFKDTAGNELPSITFILPALIRGIGAAILVFLLAKGGVAIFTKGGDAKLNAYAIFFACFVAAVFSDDVWVWARNKQRNELGGNDRQGAPPVEGQAELAMPTKPAA